MTAAGIVQTNFSQQIKNPQSQLCQWTSQTLIDMAQQSAYWSNPGYLNQTFQDIVIRNVRELILRDVKGLARLMNNHDGTIYGAFVNEFLIQQGDTDQIAVWFHNTADANSFLNQLNSWSMDQQDNYDGRLNPDTRPAFKVSPANQGRGTNINSREPVYLLYSNYSQFSYFIKIVVSEQFPVGKSPQERVMAVLDPRGVFTYLRPDAWTNSARM